MTKQIGLWIDHKRAVILTLNDEDESLQILEPDVGRRPRYRGMGRTRTPHSAQYQKGDDQLDKQFEGYLNKYYEKVLVQLQGANAVLIFGPGEAKAELKKHLESQKNHTQIIGIESADKMTDRQIAAKIRKYFQEAVVNA
ncbi:MAG: hypothetical protein OHK003_00850 [Anaerolineales bacterium]